MNIRRNWLELLLLQLVSGKNKLVKAVELLREGMLGEVREIWLLFFCIIFKLIIHIAKYMI